MAEDDEKHYLLEDEAGWPRTTKTLSSIPFSRFLGPVFWAPFFGPRFSGPVFWAPFFWAPLWARFFGPVFFFARFFWVPSFTKKYNNRF